MKCAVLAEVLESRTLLATAPAIYGYVPTVSGSTVTSQLVRIANHDASPSTKDGTAYSYMYAGGSTTRTFVISNSGKQSITIAVPSISGAGAGAFSISTPPASLTIAAGASQQFAIQFAPADAGVCTATITVHKQAAAGSAASDYQFAVNGTCLTTQLLDGGLRIATITSGTGAAATDDTVLSMNYTGWLTTNGMVFDSSLNRGRKPFNFDLGAGSVIQGWDQGLVGAKVGEQLILFIPSALGYGTTGSGTTIPANADLIFSTEVLGMAQNFRSGISVTGNNRAVTLDGTTWTLLDGTAFYSSASSGSPAYKPVTHTFVLNLGSPLIIGALQGGIGGTDSSSFAITKSKVLGGGKLSLAITYTPGTAAAPATAGSVMSAQLFFAVGYPTHDAYSFALYGETLTAGTKLTKTALTITGTANADTITLAQSGNALTVTTNGITNDFNSTDLSAITILSGAGNDTISAAGISNSLRIDTGPGNNTVTGGDGNDTILGGAGNDSLVGGAGNDSISGGAGNDTLVAGTGHDTLAGGTGTDTFYAKNGVADVIDARGGTNDVGQWDTGLDTIEGLLTALP